MRFQVSFSSGLPVYLQLVEQVKAAAAGGALKTGECLPSIRPLAEELRLNRNTIAKAYGELERQGIIETLPGKGSFVKENNSPLKKEVRRKLITDEIDRLLVQAHHLQITVAELLELVEGRARLHEMTTAAAR